MQVVIKEREKVQPIQVGDVIVGGSHTYVIIRIDNDYIAVNLNGKGIWARHKDWNLFCETITQGIQKGDITLYGKDAYHLTLDSSTNK